MFRFETKFNSNVTKNINKHAMKKLWFMYIGFSLFFILIGVLNILGEESDYIFGTVILAFGVLFFPMCFLLTKVLQKKYDDTMSVLSDETFESYTFDEKRVTIIQQKGESYKSQTEADYNYFYKAEESSEYYFFYISKRQCHVVPKDSIVEGNIEDFTQMLKRVLGPKFKYKK